MKILGKPIWCWLNMHEWTCRSELGIKPDPELIKLDAVGYFLLYAAPICKHCPKELPPLVL